jgi:hypothetical protein
VVIGVGDWGGIRPGGGAKRRPLIEHVRNRSFRLGRHLSSLSTDDSVVEAALAHPGALRIVACAYAQEQHLTSGSPRFWAVVFSRLARMDGDWERHYRGICLDVLEADPDEAEDSRWRPTRWLATGEAKP